MRIVPMISALVVFSAAPAAALACGGESGELPVDTTFVVAPPPSNDLLERAERLDRMADSAAERARHAERRAAALTSRARAFRQAAFQTDGVDRSNLLLAAGELSLRAGQEKRMAQRAVAQARDLRGQARLLRARVTGVSDVRTWPPRTRVRRGRPVI